MKNQRWLAVALALFIGWTGKALSADYGEVDLNKALELALEKNRDLIKAREDTKKAGYQIMEAVSGAMPRADGLWNYDKNLKPQVFVISFPDSTGVLRRNRLKVGTDHSMRLGANLTQPLYVGGKIGNAIEAARIYKSLSGETYEIVEQNVIFGVTQGYYSILLARELANISRESIELAEKHLENVEALARVGRATDYDILRARVQVTNLKPRLLEAENGVRLANLRLKEAMGIEESDLEIVGELSSPGNELIAKTAAETAFRNRPDYKAAELGVELQKRAEKNVRGDFFPVLTASTSFAYMGNFDSFTYNANDWNTTWIASMFLSFPIFNYQTNARLQQARVDYRKAVTDLNKTRAALLIEVEESQMNLEKALEQIESQKMNVEEARRAAEMAENLYTNGRATQLEVLDAQLALELAKTNLAGALYEGRVAEAGLRKTLGITDSNGKGIQ